MKQQKDNANEVFLCLLAMSGFLTFGMTGLIPWLSYGLGIIYLGCAVAYTIEEIRSEKSDA